MLTAPAERRVVVGGEIEAFLAQPWQAVRPSVTVKLLAEEGELYNHQREARIVHHATVLTTAGDSYRLKVATRNQASRATQEVPRQ